MIDSNDIPNNFRSNLSCLSEVADLFAKADERRADTPSDEGSSVLASTENRSSVDEESVNEGNEGASIGQNIGNGGLNKGSVVSSERNESPNPEDLPDVSPRIKFPSKLYSIVDNAETNGDFISWTEDGLAFSILKPKEFEVQVLPKYFKHGSYLSFMRQVQLYGFQRVSRTQDIGCYKHTLFQRGKPQLLRKMGRAKLFVNPKKSGGGSKKKAKARMVKKKIDPATKKKEENDRDGSKITVSSSEANSVYSDPRFVQSSADNISVPERSDYAQDIRNRSYSQNCSNYQDMHGGSISFQPANPPNGLLIQHEGESTNNMDSNSLMRQQAGQRIDETILHLSRTMREQQQNTRNASLAAIFPRQLHQDQEQEQLRQLQQQILRNALGLGALNNTNTTASLSNTAAYGNLLGNTLDGLVSQLQSQVQRQQEQLALGRLVNVHQQYEQLRSQLATSQYQQTQAQPQQPYHYQQQRNNDQVQSQQHQNQYH